MHQLFPGMTSTGDQTGKRWLPLPTLLAAGILLAAILACDTNGNIATAPPADATVPATDEPQTEYSAGDHPMSMNYDGMERTYVMHIPPRPDASQPAALVLAFHGVGLNASEMMRISGLSAQADRAGFIAVYPEGTGDTKSWNGGHCCGTAARDNVDDIGFVRALIRELSASLPIDPGQIYATGFSNGAIFTYRLACELSDVIAAFGPVSATPVEEDLQACAPKRAVPILHFHGTADDPNPYNGGLSAGGFRFVSVSEAIGFWVNFNGCSAQPQSSTSGSIQHDIYSGCKPGSAVELYTIKGGKHAWPGGEAVNQKMGEPNMEISATQIMWAFFLAHPMP